MDTAVVVRNQRVVNDVIKVQWFGLDYPDIHNKSKRIIISNKTEIFENLKKAKSTEYYAARDKYTKRHQALVYSLDANEYADHLVHIKYQVSQREVLPNTVPYVPVFGLRIAIRGKTESKYGSIRERIRSGIVFRYKPISPYNMFPIPF